MLRSLFSRRRTAWACLLSVTIAAVVSSCTDEEAVAPPPPSGCTIAVSTPQYTFSPGSPVPFTIMLRDRRGVPISGMNVGVYDNMQLICAASAPSDENGQASYTSEAPLAPGVYLLTFFVEGASSQYAVLVDDGSSLANTDSIWTSEIATGDISLGAQDEKERSIDQFVDYAQNTVIETVTSPGVILTGLSCAGALIVGAGVTIGSVGGLSPIAAGVATVTCGAFIVTTKTTLAFNAGKNGAKLAIEQMALPPEQEQHYKNRVDEIAATYGTLIAATHIVQAPKGGTSVVNYKISTNRGLFSNRYAQDFVENLGEIVDTQHEVSSVEWGSVRDGDGSIVVSYAFPSQAPTCSDTLQSYNVVSIGFALPPSRACQLAGVWRMHFVAAGGWGRFNGIMSLDSNCEGSYHGTDYSYSTLVQASARLDGVTIKFINPPLRDEYWYGHLVNPDSMEGITDSNTPWSGGRYRP